MPDCVLWTYPDKHEESCSFELYDRERGRMDTCPRKAVGKVGYKPVCEEHLIYAAAVHGEPVRSSEK